MPDDDWIKRLLRSSEVAKRKEGMILLVRTFQNPVASVLISIGRASRLSAYSALLDPESRSLDPEEYREVWQATLACVWDNVQEGKFKLDGSLLAYLVTIAKRRVIDRWRKQMRVDKSVVVESLDYAPAERPEGLLETIEQFCDSLRSEKDQVILREGVKIACANGSRRRMKKEFEETLIRICEEKGWKQMSMGAALRQYGRLKDRLRNFLNEREYNV